MRQHFKQIYWDLRRDWRLWKNCGCWACVYENPRLCVCCNLLLNKELGASAYVTCLRALEVFNHQLHYTYSHRSGSFVFSNLFICVLIQIGKYSECTGMIDQRLSPKGIHIFSTESFVPSAIINGFFVLCSSLWCTHGMDFWYVTLKFFYSQYSFGFFGIEEPTSHLPNKSHTDSYSFL